MTTPVQHTPKAEIDARISGLQRRLQQASLDAALILQKADLFYYSGTVQDASLYVPAGGKPILMVRKDVDRASRESRIETILPYRNIYLIPDILKEQGMAIPRRLGMELDVLPYNQYAALSRLFETSRIEDISTEIRMQRAVKSEYELGLMSDAAELADRMLAAVPEFLTEGIPEIELAGKIEAFARKLGHQGMVRMRLWGGEVFYGHVMAGPSAAEPSFMASPTGGRGPNPAIAQNAGFRPVRKNEPVLVDYVFALNGYIVDQTRIYAIGELPDRLMNGHAAMLTLQDTLKAETRPGARAGDIYAMAVENAEALGLGAFFMGAAAPKIPFVGHGVGLELDEFPFIAKKQDLRLETGMTIALEPKLIFPGLGVVGIENTHVVTPEGLRPFTAFNEEIHFI